MERYFSIFGDIVKFYSYRRAMTQNAVCKIQLCDKDFEYLRRKLQKAGHTFDNHIVFCTDTCNFWYTDNHVYVGGEVVEF